MRTLLALALLASACASPPPYACSTPIDPTGHGLPLCHAAAQTPVCDAPGQMAHYEMTPGGGYALVGGTNAVCDSSDQVVCPDRATSPHCIANQTGP